MQNNSLVYVWQFDFILFHLKCVRETKRNETEWKKQFLRLFCKQCVGHLTSGFRLSHLMSKCEQFAQLIVCSVCGWFHFICVLCGIFHAQKMWLCIATTTAAAAKSRVRKQRNGKWIQVKFNVLYLLSVCVTTTVISRFGVSYESALWVYAIQITLTQRDEHSVFKKRQRKTKE